MDEADDFGVGPVAQRLPDVKGREGRIIRLASDQAVELFFGEDEGLIEAGLAEREARSLRAMQDSVQRFPGLVKRCSRIQNADLRLCHLGLPSIQVGRRRHTKPHAILGEFEVGAGYVQVIVLDAKLGPRVQHRVVGGRGRLDNVQPELLETGQARSLQFLLDRKIG